MTAILFPSVMWTVACNIGKKLSEEWCMMGKRYGDLMVAKQKLRIYLFIYEKQGNSSPFNTTDGYVTHKVNLFSKDIGLHYTAAVFQNVQRKQSALKEQINPLLCVAVGLTASMTGK